MEPRVVSLWTLPVSVLQNSERRCPILSCQFCLSLSTNQMKSHICLAGLDFQVPLDAPGICMYQILIAFFTLLFSCSVYAQTGPAIYSVRTNSSGKARFFPKLSGRAKPALSANGIAVVNAASFLPGISPGALVTIFGHDLSDVSGVVVANTNPLPYELANVSVDINGVPAPIFSVAYNGTEDQISVQVPYSTVTGPGSATVNVFDYGNLVGSVQADSFDEDPGIFTYQGDYVVALRFPDYSLVGPNNPASPGDYLIVYTTGLGPLSLDLRDGYGAPSNPPAYTQDPFTVTAAGESCNVSFSGLAPGFVGL